MAQKYDALHALVSVFASGDYATNAQLFQESDDPPALMRQLLKQTFEHEATKKKNFFRALTQDNCHDRHAIIEPDLLENACPLDNGRHHHPPSPHPASLFDKLPLEIIRQIFVEELDLESLTVLRSMGSRLRSAIDQLPEYQEIVQHSPTSIRAALSLEVASTMTCRNLHNILCTQKCSTCTEFGAYLYLPTCQRACRACFTKKEEFLPLAVNYSRVHWDLSLSDLASAPIIRSLPGVYRAGFYNKTKGRIALAHKASVLEVAEQVHISLEEAATSVINPFIFNLLMLTFQNVVHVMTRWPNGKVNSQNGRRFLNTNERRSLLDHHTVLPQMTNRRGTHIGSCASLGFPG